MKKRFRPNLPVSEDELIDWLYSNKYITDYTLYLNLKRNPELLVSEKTSMYRDAITQTRIHELIIEDDVKDEHDYSKDYFTFVGISEHNVIRFISRFSGGKPLTIQVSTDGITWNAFESSYYDSAEQTGGTVISYLNAGDKLLVRGENIQYTDGDTYGCGFMVSDECSVEGNIMSLIYGSDFIDKPEFPANSSVNFMQLFREAGPIVDASNLMLPAITLKTYCYSRMFEGCTSLTTAPELPATTLADYCYSSMFSGCTSLNHIKCLATDINRPGCTGLWVLGVSPTGTFVKDASMQSWTTGPNGIPENWTVEDAEI